MRIFEHEVKESLHLDNDNPSFGDFAIRWNKNFADVELEALLLKPILMPEQFNKTLWKKQKRIKEITTFQIVQFFTREKEQSANLEKKCKLLKSIFKHAVLWKIIDERNNPMHGVSKPKSKKMKVETNKFFDKNEIPTLLKVMENSLEHQYLISALALFSGLRRGEVLAITPEVIYWDTNQIHVKRLTVI
ncbi:hypothetical protein NSQ95_05570 [Psychrobacillus sp. FSL W7-1457]|uniref:hypothetical protein n=1 Tax=unclassified Psychrobacillus TaxID=2636677 RepID=UPI0030FBBC54